MENDATIEMPVCSLRADFVPSDKHHVSQDRHLTVVEIGTETVESKYKQMLGVDGEDDPVRAVVDKKQKLEIQRGVFEPYNEIVRFDVGRTVSYESMPAKRPRKDHILFTLTTDESDYDFDMPPGGHIELSELIEDVLSFLLIRDARIYPKPDGCLEEIYFELREMLCANNVLSRTALWLFGRIDEYEKDYNA